MSTPARGGAVSAVGIDEPRSKIALAAALKGALATTPLAKVTVSGLAAAAGVNRQTFYSHFSDVYDLARWVFTTEVASHIMAHASYDQWADGFSELLNYMKQNHDQAYAVIRSLRHDELERFFHHWLHNMMQVIVAELDDGLRLRDEDREFVIDHYTLAVLGHLLHWLATDMRENPYVLIERLEFILHGSVRESLERFASRG
ncbi:MAG: TetR family transcriptional regulator C-terminal domain-containing protein [Propionibacteriales bacterium]|nr:TetR family transcriptional regulator C-terminal domain-containing protein [Propionibacteriales bacterium]